MIAAAAVVSNLDVSDCKWRMASGIRAACLGALRPMALACVFNNSKFVVMN